MQDADINTLLENYIKVRKTTERLCEHLYPEDFLLQTMADVSPLKWHLAHVTWFFETFILQPLPKYKVFNPQYQNLYNSYYESLGQPFQRAKRHVISRPTLDEVYQYRQYVDQQLQTFLSDRNIAKLLPDVMFYLQLGINHEQQHQELMLMDIKYNFYCNPLQPAYIQDQTEKIFNSSHDETWTAFEGKLQQIGVAAGFSFDNEKPSHTVYVNPFKIKNRLVTNREYCEFIEAGGYQNPKYWLSDGWQILKSENWQAPLYWDEAKEGWEVFTLHGKKLLNLDDPVCHVSYYEADAYANFKKCRLPTEFEWEMVQENNAIDGYFLESGLLQPQACKSNMATDYFGNVWQWTRSAYSPYPGFVPFQEPLTEYNGKFACNQFVLRGGCIATPKDHFRITYRNFYYPHQRWPFTGIRLAADL